MVRLVFIVCVVLTAASISCVPEEKLLKRNYIRENYDIGKIDTVTIARVYTRYYSNDVFGFFRDSASENESWLQIPKKTQRKLNEFAITVAPACDSQNSIHRCLSTIPVTTHDRNDEKKFEILDEIERREYKRFPGCNCGKKYAAIIYHFGSTKTTMKKFLQNVWFFPVQILTLGMYQLKWNEGFSQLRILLFDCNENKVIYHGINSRYFVPADSININKHIEILLAKYKAQSDSISAANSKIDSMSIK